MYPTTGLVVLIGLLLALGALAGHTLRVTRHGGLGPAVPPASHEQVDPAGFFPPPAPRRAPRRRPTRQAEAPRRRSRLSPARVAAAVHTARESRAARRMSPRVGG
ncbi:hypothetical protein GCM10023328_25590 [Modestobacter marinus]|uniref:Uncharacterized protein n=1 Tax=Modestobacter marinus TaxID=477641 RepID=A0ABQ2FWL1_9ACTN|nr:hypothetical protein GCM10011589_17290 [Modestobacter marinus]